MYKSCYRDRRDDDDVDNDGDCRRSISMYKLCYRDRGDDDDVDNDGDCRLVERSISMYKSCSQRSNSIENTPRKKAESKGNTGEKKRKEKKRELHKHI